MTEKGNRILKWGILALLLSYVAVMAVWANHEARVHVCTGIEVKVDGGLPSDSVTRQGVLDELRDYPGQIVGRQLQQVNPTEIERYLASRNTFESVNCVLSPRGKLVVRVVPMIPVMRVFFGDNSYYINKDGKHIETNAEFFSDVPVVTGRFNRSFAPRDVLPLVRFATTDPMLSELTSMIVAEDRDNLIIVPRIRGHVVNFGDTTRLDEKKRALVMFYRQVMPYKGWQEYDTISVKFRGQVVATRRDKSRLNHAEEYHEDYDLEEATLPDAGEATPATAPAKTPADGAAADVPDSAANKTTPNKVNKSNGPRNAG